jgi:hypothetical protein
VPATKEQKAAYDRKRYLEKKEQISARNSAWQKENRESCVQRSRRWQRKHPEKAAAAVAKRRAAKLQATPPWADKDAIDYVYYAAQVIHDVYGGTNE